MDARASKRHSPARGLKVVTAGTHNSFGFGTYSRLCHSGARLSEILALRCDE
jgi:hypothetical protein